MATTKKPDVTENVDEELVPLMIPRARANEENFVTISLNGRFFKVMKGVEVMVPKGIKEVYEESVAQQNAVLDLIDARTNG